MSDIFEDTETQEEKVIIHNFHHPTIITSDMLAYFFLVSKFFIDFSFFFKILNNHYPQCGAQTHDHSVVACSTD